MGNTLKKTFQNNIITFLLYYLTAVGGIKFISLPPGNLTVIWLPAGIAMGCLLVFGRKVLPAIFLGTFLSNAPFFILENNFSSIAKGLSLGIWIALIDTLQSFLGYFAHKKFVRGYNFRTQKTFSDIISLWFCFRQY